MLAYVDANVYIDFLKKRSGSEPFYRYAYWLFALARKCKFFIVLSDHAEREVLAHVNRSRWTSFLQRMGEKIVQYKVSSEDWRIAKEIGRHNITDALHVVAAFKSGARYLFTRNVSNFADFYPFLKGKVEIRHPRSIYEFT